ncbi:hypothetical protein PHISP_00979 [Aspergillus sp. HF37]|nr:hypothetical protein PHISP_00979 [Aspergillus sp. HF37]
MADEDSSAHSSSLLSVPEGHPGKHEAENNELREEMKGRNGTQEDTGHPGGGHRFAPISPSI